MIAVVESWLWRRNPTVKAGLLLVVSLGTLAFYEPWPLLVLYTLAALAGRTAARIPWRTFAFAQVPFVLFGIGIVAVNTLSRPGEPLVPGTPFRATVEGLTIGTALALRGLVIGVLTIGFLTSTPPRELMVSLVQHARLSPRYAYAILAGHRMLEAMPERWATVRAAQAVREPRRRDGRPRFGVAGFGRAAFALLVASIRSSERIALALESRGLRDAPRTIWRPVLLDRCDLYLALSVTSTLAALMLVQLA